MSLMRGGWRGSRLAVVNYLSYIIPEPDFNTAGTLLTDDGDHYEDTGSPSRVFATRLREAQATLDARW